MCRYTPVATSSNVATVVSGSPGRHTHGRATDHDGGKHTDLKMLEQDVDDVIRADLGRGWMGWHFSPRNFAVESPDECVRKRRRCLLPFSV